MTDRVTSTQTERIEWRVVSWSPHDNAAPNITPCSTEGDARKFVSLFRDGPFTQKLARVERRVISPWEEV